MTSALTCGLLIGSTLALPSIGASAATKVSIEVFGDLLSYQAASYLDKDFSKATLLGETHVYPGTALCNWLPAIERITRSTAPAIAVLEFVGNVNSCNGSVTTPAALAAAYSANLHTAIDALKAVGTRFIVVDEGPRVDCTFYADCKAEPALHDAFEKVVASYRSPDVVYSGLADRAVETPNGKFTKNLTCLAPEARACLCTKGSEITVRALDGVHFCPVGHSAAVPCPVYSSGAYRFAGGFARTIWALDKVTKPADGLAVP